MKPSLLFSAAGLVGTSLLASAWPRPAFAQVSRPHMGMTLVEHGGQGALMILDLCSPGASVQVTRYADRKATAPQWAEPRGFEAAINADFFDNPGWTYVIGRARGAGEDWPAAAQWKEKGRPYWQFGPVIAEGVSDGNAAPRAGVTDIVGGHNVILQGGKTTGPWAVANDGALLNNAYKRTGLGISADRRTLFALTTVDAVSAQTMVNRFLSWAAEAKAPAPDFATNMDGGGSSQMYVKGRGAVVSSARQVNNHLGMLAKGSGASPMCIPKLAAGFKAQSFPLSPAPLAMKVGESVDGFIELVNTGTSPWTPGTTKLAPIPRDKPSDAGGEGWLAPNRVSTVTAPVKPGEVGRFAVKLAPTKGGDWVQYFGLVEEGVAWFADANIGGGPPDNQLAVHLVVSGDGRPGAPGQPPGQAPGTSGQSGEPTPDEQAAADDEAGGCAVSSPSGARGTVAALGLAVASLLIARSRRRA